MGKMFDGLENLLQSDLFHFGSQQVNGFSSEINSRLSKINSSDGTKRFTPKDLSCTKLIKKQIVRSKKGSF